MKPYAMIIQSEFIEKMEPSSFIYLMNSLALWKIKKKNSFQLWLSDPENAKMDLDEAKFWAYTVVVGAYSNRSAYCKITLY